jgi:hypothetical protein
MVKVTVSDDNNFNGTAHFIELQLEPVDGSSETQSNY